MEIKNDEFITKQLQLDLYPPIYLQTNVHLEECLTQNDIRGKDILTVDTSGDFLFWIMQNSPRSISIFNPNIFAKYYQDLKIAGLIALKYDEFLNFFYGKETFSQNLQERVLAVLPDESRLFWEYLLNNYAAEKILRSLFCQNGASIQKAISYNPFLLNEKKYLEVQKDAYDLFYIYHNIDINELGLIKRRFNTIFLGDISSLPFNTALDKIFRISKTVGKKYNATIAFTSSSKLIFNKQDDSSSIKIIKRTK